MHFAVMFNVFKDYIHSSKYIIAIFHVYSVILAVNIKLIKI
jgi:hypothetical protein